MFEIKNICAYYGESIILKDINFKVEPGKVSGLIGRNGVGKTTLLKSIMGLVKIKGGHILFNGEDLIGKPTYYRAQAGIGYVPQGREIFPQLTVHENLLIGLEPAKGRITEIDDEIYELFPVLKEMLDRKGGALSGGQQQQLSIARALIAKPSLLILDEPTEGIQPSIIQDIKRVLMDIKQKGEVSILLVEQYFDFVMDLSDYCYVMEKGQIVLEGNVNEMDKEEIYDRVSI